MPWVGMQCMIEAFPDHTHLLFCIDLQSENIKQYSCLKPLGLGLLVGFVALRPKSTAMVIAGRSVHLTTLFPGQA